MNGVLAFFTSFLLLLSLQLPLVAQTRTVSGVVVTHKDEAVHGITIIAVTPSTSQRTQTNDDGEFVLQVPDSDVELRIEGTNVSPQVRPLPTTVNAAKLRIEIDFVIPPIHEGMVIVASAMEAPVETYNDEVYKKTLFSRDDQLLETLNAGINAGQHEGGGKSLEIRRFGFNLDHGGVNGGLKILVDDIQQNQGTQGHGQGYLGSLKALTPELVGEVNILNGPFSAEYGDFSGLGVVHIRTKESLPDTATVRLQAGSFDSYRTFLAFSPSLEHDAALLAYEGSRTNGPFLNPLHYGRDNITGNFTHNLDSTQALGFKINFGRNNFFSSGQIPLDLVADGSLPRFGFIDPSDGGRIRLGTVGVYYRKAMASGRSFKADGFISRSMFDLYSNFTLFLNDPVHGDGIQQHDSRYQEGANTQYLAPHRALGGLGFLTAGTNFHDSEINVGLYPAENRNPLGVATRAFAHVTNGAGYAQEAVDLLHGRLHVDGGLRWDYFRFKVSDQVNPSQSGIEGATKLQPKAGVAYRPLTGMPLTLTLNYGRGINTQDARGIVQRPGSPRIATTDFYQSGATYSRGGVSLSSDLFLIDRSNEQVYIPDDGTLELKGPSRSYGFEGKTSIVLAHSLKLDAGLTQVTNSFYRATQPREYVDSAPHTVANAGLTFSGWRNAYASLRYRHVGNYRLDGTDASIRASGLDVLDFALTKSLRRSLDLNIDVDNLANKKYYETQNYFESRTAPGLDSISRIHGTPGYPINVTLGLTFRLERLKP